MASWERERTTNKDDKRNDGHKRKWLNEYQARIVQWSVRQEEWLGWLRAMKGGWTCGQREEGAKGEVLITQLCLNGMKCTNKNDEPRRTKKKGRIYEETKNDFFYPSFLLVYLPSSLFTIMDMYALSHSPAYSILVCLTIILAGKEAIRLPVLMFIHGESFEWNSGSSYDGSVLSSFANLVVVTINYRLGVLGESSFFFCEFLFRDTYLYWPLTILLVSHLCLFFHDVLPSFFLHLSGHHRFLSFSFCRVFSLLLFDYSSHLSSFSRPKTSRKLQHLISWHVVMMILSLDSLPDIF